MRNMFDGRAKLAPLDNNRYPGMRWTTAREVLSARRASYPARQQELGGRGNDSWRISTAPRHHD